MTTFAHGPAALSADGMLAVAHLAGDDTAYAELYQRHYRDVLRFVRAKVRDQAVAEDVAQEAFVRALRSLARFDPSRRFYPYVCGIADNLVTGEIKRWVTEVPVETLDRDVVVLPDTADAVVNRAAVVECLQVLPQRQRTALIMRYVEDRDPNDIAALFGLSRNALEQLLLRARLKLRNEYRARNSALAPVFGAVLTRVRRLLGAFEARLHAAGGAGMSVAGDLAIGAALTFGGFGLATLTGGPHDTADDAYDRSAIGVLKPYLPGDELGLLGARQRAAYGSVLTPAGIRLLGETRVVAARAARVVAAAPRREDVRAAQPAPEPGPVDQPAPERPPGGGEPAPPPAPPPGGNGPGVKVTGPVAGDVYIEDVDPNDPKIEQGDKEVLKVLPVPVESEGSAKIDPGVSACETFATCVPDL